MDTISSAVLTALLEKSLTVTALAAMLGVSLWAIYKLWQRAVAKETSHAAELAALNTLRLEESKDYALRGKESSDHLRSMVDMQNRLLNSIELRGKADEKTHKLVVAIAAQLDIPLKNFV